MLKIILINQDPSVASQTREKISRLANMEIVHQISSLEAGLSTARRELVDLIIFCCRKPSANTLDQLQSHLKLYPIALLVFTRKADDFLIEAAIEGGISSLVVDGFEPERLDNLIHISLARFIRQRRLENELFDTQTSLTGQRTLERAKHMLMRANQVNEDEAYQSLRELALQENRPIIEIATQLVGGVRHIPKFYQNSDLG
jgi:two-component system, response regulator / RNA-binding antiterminator